ncbi:LOB domain-containing protein 10-like [Tasmannia lanceolata]|uniref:LOB domain-containing protein 10-like n=1 Tax=Tasmannia lanceolata TaxID=3420 RepID=UPI004064B85E
MASTSNSPCAACKFLRRKCIQNCIFAPHFPPDQPQKFANVHKVFGASNVNKLLHDINVEQREDAVNSLAYEAEARLCDPVYGCVGLISVLQHRLKQVQHDLYNSKKELAAYMGPSAMLPLTHQHHHNLLDHPHIASSSSVGPFGMSSVGMALPPPGPASQAQAQAQAQLFMREQQQMLEAQQLAAMVAAREQQEMMRSYEQQQELTRFNTGFDGGGTTATTGFSQMATPSSQPSLALVPFDNTFQVQPSEQEHQHHHHHQHLQQQQQHQQQHHRVGSDEVRSVGPSS